MKDRLTFLTIVLLLFVISRNSPAQAPRHTDHLSNYKVGAFAQDLSGNLWIGTSHGLNRYNGTDYAVFNASGQEGWLNNDNISALCWDSSGQRLWIGNECGIGYLENGVFQHLNDATFDPVTRILETDPDHIIGVGKSGLFRFRKSNMGIEGYYYEDGVSWLENLTVTARGETWLTFSRRDSTFLSILGTQLEREQQLFLGKGISVSGICERPSGTVWTATSEGLLCHDAGSRVRLPLPQPLDKLLRGARILFISPYMENNLLLGLAGKGMYSYNLLSQTVTPVAPDQQLTGGRYVCFVDRDNGIWLSDGDTPLLHYSDRQNYTSLQVSPRPERVSHLVFDRQGYLWMRCGERLQSVHPVTGAVVWRDARAVCSALLIDREGRLVSLMDNNRVVRYDVDQGIPHETESVTLDQDAFSLEEDSTGSLWLSHVSSFTILAPDGSRTFVQPADNLSFGFLMPCANSTRTFVVTTSQGIVRMERDGSYERLGPESLASVSGMLRTSDGTYWLGSYNRGLYHFAPQTGELTVFDVSSGLVDNGIKSVVEDAGGNIWFSTATHIFRYDIREQTFFSLHDRHFTSGQFYDLISAAAGPDGRLYFGGSGRLTVVDPTMALPLQRETPLRIEAISAGGKQLPENSPALKLHWKDNALEIRAAALDFDAGSLLNYSWKLDGYEKDWQYGASVIQAVYSYLPAGSYTFRARVREQNGRWSTQEIALPIRIQPAPWASPWAKLLYWILGLGLLGAGLWFFIRLRTQQERLALAEQREELKQQQIDFVTNISHEFRTPLSMIYAPAKELGKQDLGQPANDLVRTIGRNAERLRDLSEQLLGSGAGRPSREQLTVRQNDLVSVIRSLTGNFSYATQEKRQTLTCDLPETLICWFDTEKVGKIFANLLSNALKYTPEGGHIAIRLVQEDSDVVLSVTDDGIGIPEERRARIFGRFDRLGAEQSGIVGSGIGLNYAMNLARLHRGSLAYAPNDPAGSVFTFRFPAGREAYDPAEINAAAETAVHELPDAGADSRDLPTVLVVEDTDEIRGFLRDLLRPHYRVILASDGLEAVDNLKLGLPDLVLSDVIMPNMTGTALCNTIKSQPDWAHLPVILLTAKADVTSSIEGLRTGADAYIPKPFDPDYLLAAIEGQIANRRRIQERVLNLTSGSKEKTAVVEEAGLSDADRKLLDKIHGLLDAHLEDEGFNVGELAAELGMSYSSLYAKVKALTGKTPQAFMTTYRMNIAMDLLRSGNYNVSEVSYRVGSSSPFTFSREFKKHFGFPPSQVSKNA